ncbi:MAG: ATP-binding protein [Halieaceae bacterium]|jgi:two-component system sensor histidine kinase FlrB|nr:ATP-binding protein [Halieaceae bacterium]
MQTRHERSAEPDPQLNLNAYAAGGEADSVDRARQLESLAAVSRELDQSYRDLQSEVTTLRVELALSRRARLRELAEKERLLIRLSNLLAALPGGVLIVDASETVNDANPAALDMLGEPLLGEAWPVVAERNPELRGEGSGERHLSVSSRPLLTDGEQVVLITDTTELHDLQEQLGRRHRLAALGEMAARLAHQIRTPLASTTLYLAQLTRDDLEPEQRAHIGSRLSDRLAHMEGLIESMLSFVRGKRPTLEPLLLRDVLERLEATVAPRLPATAQLNIARVDDTLRLRGSADDLVGALSNLVMNALEMSGDSLRLELWAGARSHDTLTICVRDNGPGIDEESLPRLFDPFFTTRARGTGLGLAVVAMTVAHHGGQVRARNRAGGGAEFVIDLPMLRRDARPADNKEQEACS